MLQDNPTLQCYSFPAACSTPAPLSSRQTNLHNITSAFIPKVLVRAAVIPLSVTLYLSSSLLASGQNNFCCLGVFSFLCVSNISANKTCLHSEPQWPIGPRCCCPTSCPFHSADAEEVSFHGMLYISLKSNFLLPFCYQRISQWLEASLLGEGTGFKSFKRQWMSVVLAAPLSGAVCIGTVCCEAQWKGEGMSALHKRELQQGEFMTSPRYSGIYSR